MKHQFYGYKTQFITNKNPKRDWIYASMLAYIPFNTSSMIWIWNWLNSLKRVPKHRVLVELLAVRLICRLLVMKQLIIHATFEGSRLFLLVIVSRRQLFHLLFRMLSWPIRNDATSSSSARFFFYAYFRFVIPFTWTSEFNRGYTMTTFWRKSD